MEEADVVVFVIDTTVGITSDDIELANALRRSPKPLIVIANKVDNGDQEYRNVPEVYQLGFPEVFPVSALSGRGLGDALDAIVGHFAPEDKTRARKSRMSGSRSPSSVARMSESPRC